MVTHSSRYGIGWSFKLWDTIRHSTIYTQNEIHTVAHATGTESDGHSSSGTYSDILQYILKPEFIAAMRFERVL